MEFSLINRKKLWPRLINNYLKISFFYKNRIRSVAISIGYDCQCSCVQCSAVKLADATRSRLNFHEFAKIINEAVDLGAIHFSITGGEPLLYKESFDLISYISKNKKGIISLSTNGILLTIDIAKKLRKDGLDVVLISLDSCSEKKHDQNRGFSGAYQKVIDGVLNATNSGLIVFLSTVVTNDNLLNGEIIKLASIAKDLKATLHLNLASSVGKWGGKFFYLSNEARAKLDFLLKLPHVRQNTEAGYFSKGCKAGTEKIYITAYGDVLPCPLIQISFGNLRQESLAKILDKMRKIYYFNNSSKECLASQNYEFISQYLNPLSEVKQMPYPYELLKLKC